MMLNGWKPRVMFGFSLHVMTEELYKAWCMFQQLDICYIYSSFLIFVVVTLFGDHNAEGWQGCGKCIK